MGFWIKVHEFDGSISGFERFLSSVRASGGGDQCEDVIGGLAKASEMTFSFANKVLFLCGDAPCHGSRFHTGCGDNYPDGRFENSRDSHEVINALRQKGIDMTFLVGGEEKIGSFFWIMVDVFGGVVLVSNVSFVLVLAQFSAIVWNQYEISAILARSLCPHASGVMPICARGFITHFEAPFLQYHVLLG